MRFNDSKNCLHRDAEEHREDKTFILLLWSLFSAIIFQGLQQVPFHAL